MGANPYLSVFVKIISKFLIFNAFKLHIIRNFLAKQEKICYLCIVAKQLWSGAKEDILRGNVHETTNLCIQINDHQNLSKIASCTPVFTKFEPIIGKSTTPQMDKWRPKTMRRAPQSRLFDHQRDHFFTKKEVELLFEYIGEPCQLIEIQ